MFDHYGEMDAFPAVLEELERVRTPAEETGRATVLGFLMPFRHDQAV
jgi:hypothetical protein